MEGDLHVSAEESVEARHSSGLDSAISSGVEVLPGLIEVLGQVVLSLLTMESKMGSDDLISSLLGVGILEDKASGWLSLWSGLLDGILGNHRVHELIVTGAWSIEVGWHLSVVLTEAFESLKVIVVSLVTRVRMLLVPLGGDWVGVDLGLEADIGIRIRA